MNCPNCGRDWSKMLPPFRFLILQHFPVMIKCQSCVNHKQAGIDYVNAQRIAAIPQLPKLTGEELHKAALEGLEILYGD